MAVAAIVCIVLLDSKRIPKAMSDLGSGIKALRSSLRGDEKETRSIDTIDNTES